MKLFISADIEGTCGICSWEETEAGGTGYDRFARQMTLEAAEVCRAALDSGKVEELLIKDAHSSARNLIPDMLPEEVRIFRGWQGAPGGMMAGAASWADAAAMTGYHSAASTDGNPLAHTSNRQNHYVKINGRIASEFLINAYTAAYYGIPVIFLSGDEALCESAREICPNIETVSVSEGAGGGSISVHPRKALAMIRQGMQRALERDLDEYRIRIPEHFVVEIEFRELGKAQKGSYYPGAIRSGSRGVVFETEDYYEALRFLFFVL